MQRTIKMTVRLCGQLTFALAVLAGSLSCAKREIPPMDTLVVALGALPNTLDPRMATDANGMRLIALLFNSLVRIGPTLQVEGDAAESWTYADKVYTFRLRPGLTFANGRPLTPEDVEFSFAQYMAKDSPFQSAFEAIASVSAATVGNTVEVKIRLKEFSAKLLTSDLPVVRLLPKKEVLEAGPDFGKNPIGTGSFRFESVGANEIAFAARFEHAFAPPRVKKVVFKIIRDDFTRFLKTYQGAVDIVFSEIPPGKVASFEAKKDRFAVHKYPGLSMTYILVNLADPLLKDIKVRQALTRALNRPEIITYKLEGLGSEATSILSPASPFFDKSLANPPFSLDEAQRFLAEAGALGREITLKTSNTNSAVENGKVIAHQLSQAGLKVRLQSFEWGTFYEDVKKGNFQLATLRWIGATDPDIYRIAFHSSERPPGRNRGSYFNVDLDRSLDEGLRIADPDRRIEHYKKIQRKILEDLPMIPLWYDEQVAIVHRRVKGFTPSMNGDFSPILTVEKGKE